MMERSPQAGRTSSTKTETSWSTGAEKTTVTGHHFVAKKAESQKQDCVPRQPSNGEGKATKTSAALRRNSAGTEESWSAGKDRNVRNFTGTEKTDSLKLDETPNGEARGRNNSERKGSAIELDRGGGTATRNSSAAKRRELFNTGNRTPRRRGSPSQCESLRDLTRGGVSWKEYLPVIFHLYEMHLCPSFRPTAVPPPARKNSTEHGYKLLRFLDDGFRNERIRRSSFQPAEGSALPAPDARVPNRRWSMAVPAAGQLDPHGESHVPDTGPGYLITPALLSRLQRLHRSTSRGAGGDPARRLSTLSSVSCGSESDSSGVQTENEKSRGSSVKASGSSSFASRRQSVSSSLVGTVSRRPSVTSSMLGTPSRRGSVIGPTVLGSPSRRGSLAGPTGQGPPPRRGSLVAPAVNGSVSRRGSLVRRALYEEPYLNPVDATSTITDNVAKIPPVLLRSRRGSAGSRTSSGSDSGTKIQDSVISATSGSTDQLQTLLIRQKSGFGSTEQVQTLNVGVNSGFDPEPTQKVPISVVQNARPGRIMTKLSMGPPARRSRRASLFY